MKQVIHRQAGFTLLELLVVVVAVIILATIIYSIVFAK
jgi:prepilin-type N-terminal cleavage/methylation domain-containing protein